MGVSMNELQVVGEREDMLRNRESHRYSGVSNFDVPVVVSGTTRVLSQTEDLYVEEEPSAAKLDDFISMCNGVEGGKYGIRRVGGIGRVRVFRESSTELVLRVDGDARLYFVGVGDTGGLGLKAYAGLLGVPASYIKKIPASLSRSNFDYLCAERSLDEKCGAVDLVYCVEGAELRYEDGVGGVELLVAHRLVNVLKVKGVKGNSIASGGEDVLFGEVYARFGAVLGELRGEFRDLGVECLLQSWSLDYEGEGEGRNFVRLLLGGCEWEIGGERWQLGMTLSGDVVGKGVGSVRLGFGMFREICRNGVGVNLGGAGLLEARDRFISNKLFELGRDGDDDLRVELGLKFMGILGGEGLDFGVSYVNGGMVGEYVRDALKFFIGLGGDLRGMLNVMWGDFGEVSGEDFVRVCEEEWLFKGRGVLKAFMLEYVSDVLNGGGVFRSGLDVLNYLTFVCRSFSLRDMLEIEGGVMDYVGRVSSRLGGDLGGSGNGLVGFDGWKRKVNQGLL